MAEAPGALRGCRDRPTPPRSPLARGRPRRRRRRRTPAPWRPPSSTRPIRRRQWPASSFQRAGPHRPCCAAGARRRAPGQRPGDRRRPCIARAGRRTDRRPRAARTWRRSASFGRDADARRGQRPLARLAVRNGQARRDPGAARSTTRARRARRHGRARRGRRRSSARPSVDGSQARLRRGARALAQRDRPREARRLALGPAATPCARREFALTNPSIDGQDRIAYVEDTRSARPRRVKPVAAGRATLRSRVARSSGTLWSTALDAGARLRDRDRRHRAAPASSVSQSMN